jgi:cell division protein FtsB
MEKEEKEIEECAICFEHKISTNMHCYKCNKYICIHCCNNLSSRTSLLFTESKNIFVKYQCPYCRYINNKHIKLFNKNEIISLYYDNIAQLSISQNHNVSIVNMYNNLKEEILSLKDENSSLKDENSSLKDENSSLKDDNNLLKDENKYLTDDNNYLIDDITYLRDDITYLREDIKYLKDDVLLGY